MPGACKAQHSQQPPPDTWRLVCLQQPLNGFANGQHVDPLRAQQPASGKLKPEAAPGTQVLGAADWRGLQ